MSTTTNYNLEKYDAGNATTLGTALNHILNKVGEEIYTVTDLGNAKKTAEGFIIPGGEA